MIRFGENALFRLAAQPVIVRVARSAEYLDSVRKEVRVSRWLTQKGVSAARVLDDVETPVVVANCPVTFWHLIEEGDRTDLPLEGTAGLPEDDREFLRKRGRELRDPLAELRSETPKGPVHGARVQNLMVNRDRQEAPARAVEAVRLRAGDEHTAGEKSE